jgi:hypothetical protein
MLVTSRQLKGFNIRATDGDLGTVDDIYFDDETWGIRYFTVKTGGWLDDRRVLISPISIITVDWQANCFDVSLTKTQVAHSPGIETHKPVSRQHEAAYMQYYGYSNYWNGPYLWGTGMYPMDLAISPDKLTGEPPESAESHLRSTEAVTGYDVEASDGAIGHIDGFVIEENVWAVRYIEVATRNWLPGKKVLVSPAWIAKMSWAESRVYTSLSRDAIAGAPDYNESRPITREYEDLLYSHYGHPAYWLQAAGKISQ